MTSPDERFDDAYLDRIEQYKIYDPVRHEYRIGIGMWPAVCYHCGLAGSPKFGIHICDMAVVDWIWAAHAGRDNAAHLDKAREHEYSVQAITEEEAARQAVRRPRSEAEFWNQMF